MEAVAQAGASSHDAAAHPLAASRAEKHGKDQRYFDLMAYIVSNTISGEIMAVENYSEMVPLMGTTDEKIETVKQANEESKHIKMLASLGKRLDYRVKTEIVEPQWHNIRGHFSTAVKKKDLAACLIIQDLMTETMKIASGMATALMAALAAAVSGGVFMASATTSSPLPTAASAAKLR